MSVTSTPSNDLILGIESTMSDDYQLNLRNLFERGCRIQPNNEIITSINNGNNIHRMTYKELQCRAYNMASALSLNLGIKPGDRVGTFMWNNARHLILYYCLPSMGAVLHTINIRLHWNELDYIINHANDKIIFIDADLIPLFEKILENKPHSLDNIEKFIICGFNQQSNNWQNNIKKLPMSKCIDFEFLENTIKNQNNNNNNNQFIYEWPNNLSERSGVGLCYTSGTTGKPKGVLYSHRSQYLITMNGISSCFANLTGYDSVLFIVPMFHALSWGFPFYCMTLGCKMILYNDLRPNDDKILDLILNEKVTIIAGVPTIMHCIKNGLIKNSAKYDKIKGVLTRAVSSGSLANKDLIRWFYDNWGIEYMQLWGMTECNHGCVARRIETRNDYLLNEKLQKLKNNLKNSENSGNCEKNLKMIEEINEELLNNQSKIGLTVPGLNVKLVNLEDINEDITNKINTPGDFLVQGPFATKTYFNINNSELANKFDDNGYLITGDVAIKNEKEQYLIKDRSKDMIKTGGEWVSSVDMENTIIDLLNNIVLNVCVVGIKHPKWDERPVVILQLKNDVIKEMGLRKLDSDIDDYNNNNINEASDMLNLNDFRKECLEKIKKHLSKNWAKFQLPDDVVIWNEIPMTGTGKMSKRTVRDKLYQKHYVLPSLKSQSKL